jgi:two-component system, OmpR family, alkaline phosphatase synthesis response regulator PhoP
MGMKILVIEDDPTSQRLLQLVLEKEGYTVVTSNNGLEGFRKFKEESPDLIVLDVMLPGIDGFEISHRIHNEPDKFKPPIIMMSAKAQTSDRDAALKVGANAFLAKPVDRSILLKTISELLGTEKQSGTSI